MEKISKHIYDFNKTAKWYPLIFIRYCALFFIGSVNTFLRMKTQTDQT